MTRRDIIIIAVLVNAGLLAILFMMAINTDDNENKNPIEMQATVTEITIPETAPTEISLSDTLKPTDEGDNALKEYNASNGMTNEGTTETPEDVTIYIDQEEDLPLEKETVKEKSIETPKIVEPKTVEVTVKKGDTLEKIAKANGSTIQAIKDANGLKDDRLNIGQVLKVPVSDKKSSTKPKKELTQKSDTDKKQVSDAGPQYHTIKSGDNPWKIAKQYSIKVDDLLRLNSMDEEKARNLKIGDKIRVK